MRFSLVGIFTRSNVEKFVLKGFQMDNLVILKTCAGKSVILTIPLKPVGSTYKLIQAYPIEIPLLNTTFRVEKNESTKPLTASIKIESNYFMVNEKNTHFALLSDIQAKDCLRQVLPFWY